MTHQERPSQVGKRIIAGILGLVIFVSCCCMYFFRRDFNKQIIQTYTVYLLTSIILVFALCRISFLLKRVPQLKLARTTMFAHGICLLVYSITFLTQAGMQF
jgi:Ca2+/H+ antiporter